VQRLAHPAKVIVDWVLTVSKILFESPHHTPARAGAVAATIEVSPPTQSEAKLSPPIVSVVPPLSGTLPRIFVAMGAKFCAMAAALYVAFSAL